MSEKPRLLQGNEAIAEGALKAGVTFFAGYPITPSTEVAEIMSEELPKIGGKFIQMEDELASMACIIGASLAGQKVLTASSGPGISLKQENLGYASMTEIPCVIVNVQRLGPSTGGPTSPAQGDVMQARWGTHGDHPIITLYPSSVKECFDLTVKSVNFAEKYRIPVYLLLDESVGHMREKVVLPEAHELELVDRKRPSLENKESYLPYATDESLIPEMADFGKGYKWHVTGLVHDETGFPSNSPDVAERSLKRLMDKLDKYKDEIILWEEEYTDDADIVIVAYGTIARSAHEAILRLREEGIKVGLFKLLTIWPFPEEALKNACKNADIVLVPEMNYGQVYLEVDRACNKNSQVEGLFKVNGTIITPDEIVDKIKEVLK